MCPWISVVCKIEMVIVSADGAAPARTIDGAAHSSPARPMVLRNVRRLRGTTNGGNIRFSKAKQSHFIRSRLDPNRPNDRHEPLGLTVGSLSY